jgi:hypothetical protein
LFFLNVNSNALELITPTTLCEADEIERPVEEFSASYTSSRIKVEKKNKPDLFISNQKKANSTFLQGSSQEILKTPLFILYQQIIR